MRDHKVVVQALMISLDRPDTTSSLGQSADQDALPPPFDARLRASGNSADRPDPRSSCLARMKTTCPVRSGSRLRISP